MRSTSPLSLTFAFVAVFSAVASGDVSRLLAQVKPATNVKFSQVGQDDMKEWLSYLASDELQGRQVFTEGYGLAAQYVAEHLRTWGLKPMGANGSYLQPVRLNGYKVTRNSSVTIDSNGQTRTFKHGDHVTFAAKGDERSTAALQHSRLGDAGEADRMKAYWRERVSALKEELER